MSKENPVLYKSDIIEMYDRSKKAIYDLLGIANSKKCDINIHINEDGYIRFSVFEYCEKKVYTKTYSQSNDSISYEERESNDE